MAAFQLSPPTPNQTAIRGGRLPRIGRLTNVTVQPCLPSPSPYAYRNKAMPVLSMRDGHFISGIYEPRSHHLVPYHTCPIQGDPINDLIQKVLKKIDRSGLDPLPRKKAYGVSSALNRAPGGENRGTAFRLRDPDRNSRGTPSKTQSSCPRKWKRSSRRIARELMEEVPGCGGCSTKHQRFPHQYRLRADDQLIGGPGPLFRDH